MDTTHGIAVRRLVALGRRPEFWLVNLLLWLLISAGRSEGSAWGSAALTESLRWGGGIGLALTLGWYLRRTRMAEQFLVTLTGALALAGILGASSTGHGGLTGPYHDHQLYGSVLLILLPFCASQALTSPKRYWRWGALAALTAGMLCLLLSQTRSAWAGLVVAALVFGRLWLRHTPLQPRQWPATLTPLFLLVTGLAACWLLVGPTDQKAALGTRAATLTALSQDLSWQSRLILWRGAGHVVEAHPLTGIGLGRYPGEQWQWTQTGDPLAPHQRPSLSNEAHSFYGQTAAETGLLGLGLYLAALAAFAEKGLRRLGTSRRTPGEPNGLLIAVLSALAGQGVDALASPSWQFPEASFFFWAVLGLGLAALRRTEKQNAPDLISPSLRRAGQYAVSGSLAVVFTAQVLPLGLLLTPVEAYSHLSTVTFQSVTISQAACTSGTGTCFALKALYSDGGIQDVTFDNGGATGLVSSFVCTVAPSTVTRCVSQFGSGTTRNQIKLGGGDTGKTVWITGTFEDLAYNNAPLTGTPSSYSRKQSQTLVLTP